jgi:hypothetical protein
MVLTVMTSPTASGAGAGQIETGQHTPLYVRFKSEGLSIVARRDHNQSQILTNRQKTSEQPEKTCRAPAINDSVRVFLFSAIWQGWFLEVQRVFKLVQ